MDMSKLPLAISAPLAVCVLVLGYVVLFAYSDEAKKNRLADQARGAVFWVLVLNCVLLLLQSLLFMSAMGMISGWQVSSDTAWILSYALWICSLALLLCLLVVGIAKRKLQALKVGDESDSWLSLLATVLLYAVPLLGIYQGAVGLDLANLMSPDVQKYLAIGGLGASVVLLVGLLGLLAGMGYRVSVKKPITLRLYTVM